MKNDLLNEDVKHLELGRTLRGNIALDGSKSISNRALIALALAGESPEKWLSGLSTSKDTVTLQKLLQNPDSKVFDAGEAGTVFRFLTAYLSTRPGVKTLTGSARMQERPIGPLVKSLQLLGADIRFLAKDGFPPLQIGEMQPQGRTVRVAANVSSQFLSALLLIGPYLPEGLEVVPEGPLVSKPYLDMTLGVMRHFGARAGWQDDAVVVEPGAYRPQPLHIEADWSAASYWYALAAFSEELDLTLRGLHNDSWQGDSVLPRMMENFGIQTTFGDQEIRLQKSGKPIRQLFQWDFLECPDIAQTLAVVCAGRGVTGLFSGLETLSIKETDRIGALKAELAKVGVSFVKLPPHFSKKQPDKTFYSLEGQAAWTNAVRIATYGDHRMAMAFAALGMLGPVDIEDPGVVAKSYPGFWKDLQLTNDE